MLYFRSRSVVYALAILAVVMLLEWLGSWLLLMRPDGPPQINAIPLILFAPLAVACTVGASTRNLFGELEQTSSYSLAMLRLLHLAGLLLCGSILAFAIAQGWPLPGGGLIVVRNILGLAGVALISASVLGSGLSWTLPLTYVAAVQLAGQNMDGEWSSWAWPALPVTHVPSASIALTFLLAGLSAVCLLEPRKLST
jgi:hypothetical protein